MEPTKERSTWMPPVWGERTLLMGILNATPDSFSDGGLFFEPESALAQIEAMVADGADFIDIGAESTRPGAEPITAYEEIARLDPILKALVGNTSVPISVDTYKASVAQHSLEMGVDLINDVWGFQYDPAMAETVASFDAGAILMHNARGEPVEGDVISAIQRFLEKSVFLATSAGIKESKIILDPGIGFGMTVEQNLTILRRVSELKSLGFPILLGASRKSVIGKTLDLPVDQRLEGTLATTTVGVQQGVDIIRVHDIEANRRTIQMAEAIYRHG
ncbi:MAG: dihydropteroate synthase [Verrucomicrobiota bacterium]